MRGVRAWGRPLAACVPMACAALGTRSMHAQQPATPRRDTLPTSRDTVPSRRDTLPTTPSDSALRDSVLAQILAEDSARAVRPAAFSLFRLDRLRLQTVGVTYGWTWPGQAVPTRVYSLHADYGEVFPFVRVLFVSSYWTTRYTDDEVQRLAREVQRVAAPDRPDTLHLGRIRVSDLSAGPDVRWEPGLARVARRLIPVLQPWVSGGVAVHFVNVDGAPVSGTFIESALDAASLGLNGGAGVDVRPLPNVQLTAQARYDFVGSVRYASVRVGGSFVFGPTHAGGKAR